MRNVQLSTSCVWLDDKLTAVNAIQMYCMILTTTNVYVTWQLVSTIENNNSMVLIIRYAKSYKYNMDHMAMGTSSCHIYQVVTRK